MMEMYLGPLMVLRQIPERPTSTDRSPTIIWRRIRAPRETVLPSPHERYTPLSAQQTRQGQEGASGAKSP